MMQLELEFGPMLLGFTIGTVFFTVQRLTAPRQAQVAPEEAPPAPPPRGEGEAKTEEWEQWPESEDEWELPAEPGPEPAPRSDVIVSQQRRLTPRVTPVALLFGLALVVGALWATGKFGGKGAVEQEPAPGPPAMPELQPVAEPVPEVAIQVEALEPEVKVQEPEAPVAAEKPIVAEKEPVRADEASTKEEQPAIVTPPIVEQAMCAAPTTCAAVKEEPAIAPVSEILSEDLFSGPVVTLSLTRQQVAVMQDEEGDNIYYKSAYWGTIAVGNPKERFKVVFDTGSGHLIVPSTYCHSETCRAHRRYRRSLSKTAVDIDYDGSAVKPGEPRDQITVSFGTGEVTGIFIQDMVCPNETDTRLQGQLATRSATNVGCVPLRMIAATDMSEEPFRTFEFDGVLGMGLPGLSQAPEFNFLHVIAEHLLQKGSRTPNLFSVFLAETEAEGSSTITIGGYASDRLQSELSWNPVLDPDQGHWLVHVRSVSINGREIEFCQDGECRAVVDTGTSLLAVPTVAFPEIYELLRHEADPEHDCRGPGPKLEIQLDNFLVELTPRDYARPDKQLPEGAVAPSEQPMTPVDDYVRFPELPDWLNNSTEMDGIDDVPMCKPMLMSMELPAPIGPKLFVLGEPVLRKYYTVYDSSKAMPRIGFALARHDWVQEAPEQLQEGDDPLP